MLWMDDVCRTLVGRYELAEVIGRGGMGTVYRAVDVVLGRSVAVKTLPALLADQDPTSVARFEREARAAAALSHPAVVAVYDMGVDEATRFIVMEFVVGRSLEAILRDEGPLDPDRAASIAAGVADALAAAHGTGIVHRDIKPANVMIAQNGSVKVLDFGIARAMDATTLTQNASVLGTAAYMAPEQALGEPADERSDIYSLGCVLYALIAGHAPFTGEAAAAILHQHANVAPRQLRGENSRVSPALNTVVMQMIAKAPDERPQTATQVRDRLTTASSDAAGAPPTTAPTIRQRETTATRALSRVAHPAPRRLAFVGALVPLVFAIAVIALSSGGGSRRPTASSRHSTTASKATTTQARSPASVARFSTPSTTTTNTTPATSAPTTSSQTAPPRSVAGSAGALSALATQDVQSGTIDQQAAQQITNALSGILHSYEMEHAADVQHKLADMAQHLTMLDGQGHISPAAAAPLHVALANLDTALLESQPETSQPPGGQDTALPAHDEMPPGHGGEPPGQAKKRGDPHEEKHGD
jgi:serine/threonine-protein kinase